MSNVPDIQFISDIVQLKAVTGNISHTTDVWESLANQNYVVDTGHFIEEKEPYDWKLKSAVLGFVRISGAHTGVRLGQVLYKIGKRLGIEARVRFLVIIHSSYY